MHGLRIKNGIKRIGEVAFDGEVACKNGVTSIREGAETRGDRRITSDLQFVVIDQLTRNIDAVFNSQITIIGNRRTCPC